MLFVHDCFSHFIVRVNLQNLTKLCTVVTECASAFCIDFWLQTHMFQCGVLWHLLLYLFNYDYTLEESGKTLESLS